MFPAKCPMCGGEAENLITSEVPGGRMWTWHERADADGMSIYCGPFEMKPVAMGGVEGKLT